MSLFLSSAVSTGSSLFFKSFQLFPSAFLYGYAVGAIGYGVSTWIGKWFFRATASSSFQHRVDHELDSQRRDTFFSLVPSTVHALIQIIGSAYVSIKGPYPPSANPITHFDTRLWVEYGMTRFGPTYYMGIFVGYLLADYAYIGSKNLGPLMTGHHLLASACWTICTALQCMQWLASFLQFNECSTLFVNLRQFLLTAGYDSSSKEVVGASLAMFVTFGVVRVFPLPKIVYNWITKDYNTLQAQNGTGMAVITSLFITSNVLMQTYWFSIMVRKLISVLIGGGGAGGKTKSKKE